MTQYGWTNCPPVVKAQLKTLQEQLQELLGDNLRGLYLHGSLAMGCFNPERSDLDLLAVTAQHISLEIKRQLAELLLRSSLFPKPIEISFLVASEIQPFQQPLPFDFHYSEMWREKYFQGLRNGQWQHWNDQEQRDPDLTAHITILNHRGVCLYGQPIREVFPAVPVEDYKQAIVGDYQEAYESRLKNPIYFVLNACRVYAYLAESHIFSKDEGAVWALEKVPEPYHPVIKQVLAVYRSDKLGRPTGGASFNDFAHYINEQIAHHLS